MFDRLKSLLFGDCPAPETWNEVHLAAAALLVEAAMTDGSMTDSERDLIGRLLQGYFGLTAEAASGLRERATALQESSSQLFPFTKIIVDHIPPEQRVTVIEMLWEVAYADGHLHDYVASLVRQLAGLLYVSDHDSGIARQRATARLGTPDAPLV